MHRDPRGRLVRDQTGHGGPDARDEPARRCVLGCLADAAEPLGAREVARRTHLTTLVAVPALAHLLATGIVSREFVAGRTGEHRGAWHYSLTRQGAQAAKEPPTPPRDVVGLRVIAPRSVAS